MHCLVTGGAGFIGSHLVDLLVREGHQVRVLDDLSSGNLDNLAEVKDSIEFINGSITDEKALSDAIAGTERIFHLAALVSVPDSISRPWECLEKNDRAVFRLYEQAVRHGVKRVVYSSSAAVYGNQPVPHTESLCPDPVASPYGICKFLGEQYGRFFYRAHGLESVYLRYFNVYGPRQNPTSPYSGVISIFMDNICRGQDVTIHGDGMQTRDFIYVSDVVRANILAAFTDAGAGDAFNIATGSTKTILDVHRTIGGFASKSAPQPLYGPSRQGDIRDSLAKVGKAADVLGFQATVPFETGMRATWNWYTA